MKFAKAHGLGNDFLLVAEAELPAPHGDSARRLCDRHRGVGGDGVIAWHPLGADRLGMRLWNADGSDGGLSGNGLRCLAAWAFARGHMPARHVVLPPPGPRPVKIEVLGGSRFRVETGLGPAILGSREIPTALSPEAARVIDHPLAAAGETLRVTATSLGNPHCAVFCETVADDAWIARVGPALERHPFFPERTNVEFVTVVSPREIRVRFWERGVGPTEASGTGSASAVVAAILHGLVERDGVRAVCDGGVLEVAWPEGGDVLQTGEVELLYEGDWSPPLP